MTLEWMKNIDRDWTLFLDRDGVINWEKEGDYIRNKDEFQFLHGVLDAFPILHAFFNRIFIVTNQKGVAKGLMTEQDLIGIHHHMEHQINLAGGKIDRIYACLSASDDADCRKPNPGMAFQASRDFPDVSLSRSVMIGNTLSDMEFGRAAGMFTVFLPSGKPLPPLPDDRIDAFLPSLLAFAKGL